MKKLLTLLTATLILSACGQNTTPLDRIYTPKELYADQVKQNKTLEFCRANPALRHELTNCINADHVVKILSSLQFCRKNNQVCIDKVMANLK